METFIDYNLARHALHDRRMDVSLAPPWSRLRDCTSSSSGDNDCLLLIFILCRFLMRLQVRAITVFPILIPTLVTVPMNAFNANALASLVTVAGSSLSKRLPPIITGLVASLETEKDREVLEAVQGAMVSLVASVSDIEGLHSLMMMLLAW